MQFKLDGTHPQFNLAWRYGIIKEDVVDISRYIPKNQDDDKRAQGFIDGIEVEFVISPFPKAIATFLPWRDSYTSSKVKDDDVTEITNQFEIAYNAGEVSIDDVVKYGSYLRNGEGKLNVSKVKKILANFKKDYNSKVVEEEVKRRLSNSKVVTVEEKPVVVKVEKPTIVKVEKPTIAKVEKPTIVKVEKPTKGSMAEQLKPLVEKLKYTKKVEIKSTIKSPVVVEEDRLPVRYSHTWNSSGYSYLPVSVFIVDVAEASNDFFVIATTVVNSKGEEVVIEDFPMTPLNRRAFKYLKANIGKKASILIASKNGQNRMATDIMTKYPQRYMSS